MKKILLMILSLIICLSAIVAVSAAEEKTVSNLNEFIEAMKASGTATVKLTRRIECSHKMDSDGHTPIVVNGNKTRNFWDGRIRCEEKPLRLKIRNICGDETVWEV